MKILLSEEHLNYIRLIRHFGIPRYYFDPNCTLYTFRAVIIAYITQLTSELSAFSFKKKLLTGS